MAASKAKKDAKGNKAGNEARADRRRKKGASAAARGERAPAASLAKRAKKVVGESVRKAARVAKKAVAGAKQGVEKGASRLVQRASAAKRGASKKARRVGKDALAVKATVGKKVQGVARQAGRAAEAVIEKTKPVKPMKQVKQVKQVKPEAKAAGEIAVGSAAPAFELPDQAGNLVSSESLRGQPYVLYFYPKDDTPGCTTEACGFRDFGPRFGKTGVRVIGVSPDSEKSHARFAEKYGLPFTLLSDADKSLAQAYGVWVEKQNYGRTYMGIDRSTFLIDADGRVQKVWRRVRVPGHVDSVLEAATAL